MQALLVLQCVFSQCAVCKLVGLRPGSLHSRTPALVKHAELDHGDRNGMALTEAEDIKKSGKNTQKNCTKKIFMTQIIMTV